jgi:queuine tRNA-ribosyltransferase
MDRPTSFKFRGGRLPLPFFFPDATRAVVKTIDSQDLLETKTPGILVNTYHLFRELGDGVFEKFNGVGNFMNYHGGIISDSGGFQVMSLIKKEKGKGKVTDEGVIFKPDGQKKILLTPEKSIRFQMSLQTDMLVVLDDFTDPKASYKEAKISVERTIAWAKRSKAEFERICREKKLTQSKKPYLLGVAQGGEFQDLREECTKKLVEIGFDGLGYGGWPISSNGGFDYQSAETIAENTPKNYFLYGLGVGKPDEIAKLVRMGYSIFDCVLPTRDARHKRLYVYNADSINEIDLTKEKFLSLIHI